MIYLRLRKDLEYSKYAPGDICALYFDGEHYCLPDGTGSTTLLSSEDITEYFDPEPIDEIEAQRWLANSSTDAHKQLLNAFNAEPTDELAPALIKNSAVEIRNLSHKLKRDLNLKQESIKRTARITMAYAEARRQDLEKAIAPLKNYIEKLEEMVWTVNLYLGRDEQICRIRSGANAPPSDPLVIRQRVLAMDEEIALSHWTDFDFQKIELFDEWIQDPQNLEQVLPESKGLAVLSVRATPLPYRGVDPWTGAILNKENAKTYWLCRNGENLFRIWADIQVGKFLFNNTTQGISQFSPGSDAYYKSLEHAQDVQKQHLRNALVLQGLIDRTRIFYPFLEGIRPNLSDPSTWKGVKFLTDAEKILGEGRPSFPEWLKTINAQLSEGQRVTGNFSHGCVISPKYAEGADSEEIRTVQYDPQRGFFFLFERTDDVRNESGYGAPERRASCLLDPAKPNWINFDRAKIEDMQFYLHSRETRLDYHTMVPLLQRCIALKQTEQTKEAPFRALLSQKLLPVIKDPERLPTRLDELIFWWKAKNRKFRPLVGDTNHNNKAYLHILAEARRREQDTPRQWERITEALPKGDVPICARIRSNGQAVQVAIIANEHPVFVHWLTLEPQEQSWRITKKKDWCGLAPGDLVGLDLLFKDEERLKNWKIGARRDHYLSDPDLEALKAWLAERDDIILATYNLSSGTKAGTQVSVDIWPNRKSREGKTKASSRYDVHFSRRKGSLSFLLTPAYSRRLFYDQGDVCWLGHDPLTLDLGPVDTHESIFYLNRTLLKKAVYILEKQGRQDTKNFEATQYIRRAAQTLVELSAQKYLEQERARYLSDGGDPEFWEDHQKTFSVPKLHSEPLYRWLEVLQEHQISPEQKTWRDIRRLALKLDQEAPSICPPFPDEYQVPKDCPWTVTK